MLVSVTKEIKYANELISSAQQLAPVVGPSMDARYSTVLTEAGGAGQMLPAIVADLRTHVVLTESSEIVYLAALRNLNQLRKVRTERKGNLYRVVLTVRSTVEAAFGRGQGTDLVGLDANLVNVESEVLRRYSRVALSVLEDPEFSPPEGAVNLEWIEAVQGIRPSLGLFEETLVAITSQRREVEEARRQRQKAVEELHKTNVNSADLLEAFYNLSDAAYHADRLRPGTRSRRRDAPTVIVSDEASDEGGSDTGDDAGEGTESPPAGSSPTPAAPDSGDGSSTPEGPETGAGEGGSGEGDAEPSG